MEGRQRQEGPLRRCFQPRPPLSAGFAGVASGCRSMRRSCRTGDRRLRSHSGRLSGLLSGCPPTDTRPQARAKMSNAGDHSIFTENVDPFPRMRLKESQRRECCARSRRSSAQRFGRSDGSMRAALRRRSGTGSPGCRTTEARGSAECRRRIRRGGTGRRTPGRAANAAPRTPSAPIRIAALTTVSTFLQEILRSPVRRGCTFMRLVLLAAAISPNPASESSGVATGLGGEQARFHQCRPDAVDLGPGELDERRPHDCARQAAE